MALHLVTDDIALEQKLKVGYSAWARGDTVALASLFSEDCEFTLVGNTVLNPHAGLRVGLLGLMEALDQFHRMFEIREFLIEKIVVRDDDAFVHWHSSLLFRPSGRVIESERCDLIRFRGRLIQSVKCFYDSASMAIATGRAQVATVEAPVVAAPAGLKAS
ncbi:MAG: nuclear transport factor 2 family protein [Phreatobacter sp.]|uniref:nuclear transport factor 2 family protein n=1 Tax=Phreatobacter sp. TaxID=1966341 RepID=UPI00273293A6|nr:nuclear transport factor 2 family protein [Phreatobacter sp.]MDP2803136.1 nuclear transport factor 2 family protein [Phreatobacter sp.]